MAIRMPSSVGAAANPPSGSAIIKLSGGTFIIRMQRFQFSHSVDNWQDVKGDGDAYPVYAHNGLQGGSYRIIGVMETGSALGLQQLSGTSNPGVLKVILDNSGDAGSVHTVTVLVTSVQGSWWSKYVQLPVTINCVITNTNPANIEGSS